MPAFFVFTLVGCTATWAGDPKIPGYNFNSPANILKLPEVLKEISGLVVLDSNTIACVQDEKGTIFIYDLNANRVKNKISFQLDGDYEDITRVGDTYYLLRSEGTLFEIYDVDKKNPQVVSHKTGISAKDNEGLCYDPIHNRLLIASKSKNLVFAFDLITKTLMPKPLYDFKLKGANFSCSGIAIHPITKKLFALSAQYHLVLVFDAQGKVDYSQALDPKVFSQPEGIAFMENGDLLIANEGKNTRPTLVRLNYLK